MIFSHPKPTGLTVAVITWVNIVFPNPLTDTFIVWQKCWVKMTLCATEPSPNPSRSQSERWVCHDCVRNTALQATFFVPAFSLEVTGLIFTGEIMLAQVRRRSVHCESGRLRGGERCRQNPEETGARWGSRMTAEAESMKTLWLSWRGTADRSINIWWLLSNILFSIFLFFPFMTRLMVYSFSCWWDLQISTETISTVENTNQNYVDYGVVTTEGNADGNFKHWLTDWLHSTYGNWWWKRNTNANKQSAAFGRAM